MRTAFKTRWLCCLSLLLLSSSLAAGQETSAEKARKVLEQPITLNFTGQDLNEVVNHLRSKTGVNFVLDPCANVGVNQFAPFGNPVPAPGVEIKSDKAKLQTALQRLLDAHNLTYVILENSVLITCEETAAIRQLTQRISLRVSDVPLQKALKDITRTTPLNLVLDPRVVNKAQNPVSLELEGVTAETAIRLLAELGGLKAVRVDNVLFVTTEALADKMRQEQPPLANPHGPNVPNIFGFGVAPAPVMPPNRIAPPAPPPPLPLPK